MLIGAPTIAGDQVSVDVRWADSSRAEIAWRLPDPPDDVPADLAFPVSLLLAMRRRETLEFTAPVSERMLTAAAQIQEILLTWSRLEALELDALPLFERTAVRAPAAVPAAPVGRGVACFFSGGADSFHSVLQRREELTALIFVHGFDVALDDAELRATVVAGVRCAAAELGLPLVEVECDVRTLSEPLLGWDDFFGAALASVAHLLGDRFHRVYIPASVTYATLLPLGSHPMIDPLWSSERVEVVHDGADATRNEKLAAIADDAVARRWLRVCWRNPDGVYNCGRCPKCLRTMVGLRVAGVADQFTAFPPLDLEAVADVPLEFGGWGWSETLDVVDRAGTDPDLAAALRTALRRVRAVPGLRDDGRRTVADPRRDALEVLGLAAEIAVERDALSAETARLQAQVAELLAQTEGVGTAEVERDALRAHSSQLEARLTEVRESRAWRAVMTARRLRARVLRR